MRGVVAAGFVPGVRSRARAALRDLLEEFVAAVRAEPFDPSRGARIGAELVDLRMSAPPVLGTTVTLFAGRLPAAMGGPAGDETRQRTAARGGPAGDESRQRTAAMGGPAGDETRQRIMALLGTLSTGFVAAQRDAALRAAEEMNRAEKIHWRGVQADLQRRLQQALLHRPDTGLPNEQYLRKHLAETIAGRGGERLGLCLVSLDRYDEVTDTLGHENGVLLLAEVARRLRPLGFLAHLADDQFAILLVGTGGVDDVLKVADRVSRLLAHEVAVTAGVVERAAAGTDPDGWLHDARLALRWATQDNARPGVFEAGRAEDDRRRHRVAATIPAALAAGEFTLRYQPLVRLADRAVIGVEALARWHRLEPRQFIPMAERTGVIHELGRHLLERACRAGAAREGLRISVNVSPVQLAAPGLVATVADVLHRTGLPAGRLQLEITETAAVIEHRAVLDRLAGLGLRLALDDFGTGYASLAELVTLPFAEVKLAAEFLAVPRSGTAEVLRGVVGLCHALGVTVTAEGIETAEQERVLREAGCDHGQGFLFGRPEDGLPS
ncbi:putative bifunctional diguanylate cyclase/phosphodiesterase [Actinoplanes sp. NPDC048988]|uniref:putative bifunctional diguanylate cyclase/phosphodiesterase n=1 Tax=Actinoplanes sp. NPDC048988 TaxID=3363901 RepID=UPI003720B243